MSLLHHLPADFEKVSLIQIGKSIRQPCPYHLVVRLSSESTYSPVCQQTAPVSVNDEAEVSKVFKQLTIPLLKTAMPVFVGQNPPKGPPTQTPITC